MRGLERLEVSAEILDEWLLGTGLPAASCIAHAMSSTKMPLSRSSLRSMEANTQSAMFLVGTMPI